MEEIIKEDKEILLTGIKNLLNASIFLNETYSKFNVFLKKIEDIDDFSVDLFYALNILTHETKSFNNYLMEDLKNLSSLLDLNMEKLKETNLC